jgi:signal transduction histidine kinase
MHMEPYRGGRHSAPGRTAFGHRLVLVLALSGLTTVAAMVPVLTTEPFFVGVTTIVVLSFAGLGLYLALEHGERFAGRAFVAAGAGWVLLGLDVHPPWGPLVSWLLGGAVLATAIGAGILRYGRSRLDRAGRWWVAACVVGTPGSAAAVVVAFPPGSPGFGPDAFWPVPWAGTAAQLAVTTAAGLVWLGLGAGFAVIARRLLRSAPPVQRRTLRPLVLASAGWGATVVAVTAAGLVLPDLLTRHASMVVVGLMWVKVTIAVAVTVNRSRMLAVTFVETLPRDRTPEAMTSYVRTALSDPTAELLFVVPDRAYLIDGAGRPREVPGADRRFAQAIHGSGGQRVAVLVADPRLREDPTAVRSFARVLSIVAENQQLHAVLRMRLAQLGAVRTAERLAYERARDEFRRDLHDGVQQTIAAARMDLDGILDCAHESVHESAHDGALFGAEAAVELAVADVDGKLKLALDQIRSLKRGAVPPELTFGLCGAVHRTIAELRLDATARIGADDLGVLTVPVYYLVREALTNMHKYAGRARAEVVVARAGGCVEVVVRDDGAGGAGVRPGGGLAGLRDRVVDLGGTLEVHSPPGVGTLLRAVVPLVPA